jgi:sulfur relay (sulfurtransferase) DsrF/TusC family protein
VKFLFVMQTPAYSGTKVQEVLDVVLITAAFDQKVSLLLLDDAVFHLKNKQQNMALHSSRYIACSGFSLFSMPP